MQLVRKKNDMQAILSVYDDVNKLHYKVVKGL